MLMIVLPQKNHEIIFVMYSGYIDRIGSDVI